MLNKLNKSSCSIKRDNKGFSLLELLVAIAIFGVVVSPFLHTFVTSANTNTKAKRMLRATAIAENMMETISGKDTEEIKLIMDSVSASDISDTANVYHYVLQSISQGDLMYEAEVTVDASGYYSADPSVQKANDKEIVKIEGVDMDKDLFYNLEMAADNKVYADFAQKSVDYLGAASAKNATYFSQIINREFTIEITLDSGLPEVVLKIKYSVPAADTSVKDSDKTYERAIQLRTSSSTSTELRNIYFLYVPNYNSINGSIKDVFTIKNATGGAVSPNVYIVKQVSDTSTALIGKENLYKARVNLVEGTMLDITNLATTGILTNFNINLGLLNDGSATSYIIADPTEYSYNGVTGAMATAKMKINDLVGTESGDRLYDVTVSVYQDGAFNSATKTFDSKKFIMKLNN